MKRLCGVNPPVITIFDEHHKVDIESSKRQADFLISKGVDGLAYLGTSGEFSIMTVEEKKNFINEMIKYVNGRVNVIVGVDRKSTRLNSSHTDISRMPSSA